MTSLLDLLEAAWSNPETSSLDRSLSSIEHMCRGYAQALRNNGVHEFGSDFNERFCRYLESRHGLGTDRGWASAIEANLQANEAPLERLRVLVQGFRDSDF